MHLNIAYKLAHGDASTVSITPAVWIRWERRFKTKIGNLEKNGLGYEDLAYLAYEAAKAVGDVKGTVTFDQFIDQLEQLDADGMDPNPTNPGA